ncbi:MAG TPA: AAA family ATPase [Myxococcaceae bacterium]|nr:AAA family ATPase [Myxococcaceae bacterium]
MRLTRVHVTGLFGLFEHEIRLNSDERVTIIHGPNGFGKTLVLRMTEALISGNYELFYEVPFKSFTLDTDTGLRLLVEREELTDPEQIKQLKADVYVGVKKSESNAPRYWLKFKKLESPLFGNIRMTGVLAIAPPMNSVRGEIDNSPDEPTWVSRARSSFPRVRLVRTQRLGYPERRRSRLAVDEHSADLVAHIKQKLAEYAARSQELDRTFPVRLLNRSPAKALTAETLRERLAALEGRRTALTQLGFLEPEQGTRLGEASVQAIETKREVLSVYVEDMASKLAIFDELASKIQVFTRIINERFLLKSLAIHRDQGFVFTSANGALLKPSALSSGEQHELILFYELLFRMKKNELLLIDEPEISLHVAWQERFLGDLSEVVKLSEIDAVIATHSPEIIGDHWDLTVELKGPDQVRRG